MPRTSQTVITYALFQCNILKKNPDNYFPDYRRPLLYCMLKRRGCAEDRQSELTLPMDAEHDGPVIGMQVQ